MRRYLPVFTLLILSPWIAEVLFGATPLSRLGLIFGPLIMVMVSGSFFVTAGNRMDQFGVGIFGIITIILLAFLARQLQHRIRGSIFVS